MLPQPERCLRKPCCGSPRHRCSSTRTTRTKHPTQCCSNTNLLLIYVKNRNCLLRIYLYQPYIYKTNVADQKPVATI